MPANQSGVASSTIYSMLNEKNQDPGVVFIQKICDGSDISVRTFFDDPLFENPEQEIQQTGRISQEIRLVLLVMALYKLRYS